MAEASPWTSSVQCRYFLHGACKQGDQCKFAHDYNTAPSMICRYYLKGCCAYGANCRFDHVKLDKNKTNEKNHTKTLEGIQKPSIISECEKRKSKLVSLKRGGEVKEANNCISPHGKPPEEWVKAKEFVPGEKYEGSVPSSYAKATSNGQDGEDIEILEDNSNVLCPYAAGGECWYGDNCTYLHGNQCELCGLNMLHPTDEEQRKQHLLECTEQHEEDMELSFAIARSKDKACGICMDIVVDKQPISERRFGILPNCNHIFCLNCIRKWRCAKQFENKIIRACPECRVQSDFVAPSQYWVEAEEDKAKLIEGYKSALSSKPCRYFDQGKGECPFNEKCFYLHAYPDGRKAEPQPRRTRRRENANGERDFMHHSSLWEFLQVRDELDNLNILDEELSILLLGLMLDSDEDSDDDSF
ncbi:hypothetical protein LOTGIDRAFT_221472 [Lottia gigantea]|uniref:RING-type E3 ubiquitin transferase n=1 Tax=Lottia gigantea TaxID=225164 RepID=V3ZRP1_LOTGI|nr:hypothetical protein LOTGIDRAFT_221472 [Lottia gigantea]ESO85220.1 hypothetical protein LOTGIDRAFT_221472 [Lottia gigantea]